MKIQYEVGDQVWVDTRPEICCVVKVHLKSVTVRNDYGEQFNVGKRQVAPATTTLQKAKWVTL